MNTEWINKITENINSEKEKLHRRDQRYFQVDQIIRIAERLNNNEDDCIECRKHKIVMEDISLNLANYITTSPAKKREFEKKTDAIKNHLKLAHNIFPVYYYVGYFSFVGLASGIIIGLLLGFAFPNYFYQSLVFFLSIGLIAGYYSGNSKDNKVRRDKRLL